MSTQNQGLRAGVLAPHGQRQRQRAGAPALHVLGVHVGAEDGVDAGLVAGVLAEPAEQVSVEAHGDDFFWHRHDDLCVFPEGVVGGVGVGIGKNSAADFGRRHAAQPRPVRAALALERVRVRLRCFASSAVSRAAPSATRNCFSRHAGHIVSVYLHNVKISKKRGFLRALLPSLRDSVPFFLLTHGLRPGA